MYTVGTQLFAFFSEYMNMLIKYKSKPNLLKSNEFLSPLNLSISPRR